VLLGQSEHGMQAMRHLEVADGIGMIEGGENLVGQPPVEGGKTDIAEIDAPCRGRCRRFHSFAPTGQARPGAACAPYRHMARDPKAIGSIVQIDV